MTVTEDEKRQERIYDEEGNEVKPVKYKNFPDIRAVDGRNAFRRYYDWYRDMREGSEEAFREAAKPLVERIINKTDGFQDIQAETFENEPELLWPMRMGYRGLGTGRLSRRSFAAHVITEAEGDPERHNQYEYMTERMENKGKLPTYDDVDQLLDNFIQAMRANLGGDDRSIVCNKDAEEQDEELIEEIEAIEGKVEAGEASPEEMSKYAKLSKKQRKVAKERSKLTTIEQALLEHLVDEKMSKEMRMSGDRYQEDQLTNYLDDELGYDREDNSQVDDIFDDLEQNSYLVRKQVDLGDEQHNLDYVIMPRRVRTPVIIEAKKAGYSETAEEQCERMVEIHRNLKEGFDGEDFLYVADLMGFFGAEHIEYLKENDVKAFYEHDKKRPLKTLLRVAYPMAVLPFML